MQPPEKWKKEKETLKTSKSQEQNKKKCNIIARKCKKCTIARKKIQKRQFKYNH